MDRGSRIKVTHVLTRPELGGAQGNTLHTVRHLDRSRFAPSLVTSPDGPLAGDMAAIDDAEVIFLPELVREIRPGRDWRAAAALRGILDTLRPDIVHTHSSKAGILGRWAARRCGVPVVVHSVHGFPFHDFQPAAVRTLYVGLERAAARLTDRFVCVSRADIAKGERHGIFRREQVSLIRSGVDLAACRTSRGAGARLRAEIGLPAEVPLVGMVACLKAQKDPVRFVHVAAEVRRRCPEARFILVGDGALRGAVEAEIAARRLQDVVTLTGWRRDVPAVIDACDVMVLTSRHEGLPRVVPEAMACARPVVATAVDGTPEAVEDGATGYLFQPGDVAAAAGHVARLLDDPEEAQRLGQEGARRAHEFDIDAMVTLQEEMYLGLVESATVERHVRV